MPPVTTMVAISSFGSWLLGLMILALAAFRRARGRTGHEGLLVAGIAILFAGVALDVTLDGFLAQADRQSAMAIAQARDPRLLRFLTHATALADRRTITVLMLGLSAALLILRQRGILVGLWAGVLGSAASVEVLKLAFSRPRPGNDAFALDSFSFPSGHAAGSLVFFVLVFHVLWRIGWLHRGAAATAAILLALLVGFSRLYLLVHYPSDIVAGYMVASAWVIIAIAWIEAGMQRHAGLPAGTDRTRTLQVGLAISVGLAGLLVAGFVVAGHGGPSTAEGAARAGLIAAGR